MEEILASIRRILNEDEQAAAPAEEPPPEDDVLVLDQSMLVSPPEPVAGEGLPAEPPPEPQATAPAPPRDPPPEPDVEPPAEPVAEPPSAALAPELIGPGPAAAAASSVGSLVRTLAAGRAMQVYSGGPTLEDIVRAELRPLLKDWLDTNLPPLVERLVRAEIERVVGRAIP